MDIKRDLYSELLQWKRQENRKPLILRGARQVGKTTLIRSFAKEYQHYIELNLERTKDKRYFQTYSDPVTLLDALFLEHNLSTDQREETLLFIDEIQESPKAIALLRYFHEDIPALPIIAAGSLLEHVMQEVKSFPVGRVAYLYQFPLNFPEFLEAKGHPLLREQLGKIPIPKAAHEPLLRLFHEYTIVGGMPEVIQAYLNSGTVANLTPIYESIWTAYKDDVEKYASNPTEAKVIRHIINTAHLYVDQRIKYEGFGQSNYRYREVSEAMNTLNDARIIQIITPTTDVDFPIKPNLRKAPRLQFLDTGLLNHELGIQGQMLALDDLSNAYKGAIIPHMLTQEVLSLNKRSYSKPCFWVREKKQSSAEVDLVLSHDGIVIPIEIKSGKVGKLRSLHQFIERAEHHYAIRIYGGKFTVEEHKTPIQQKSYFLMNIPYYLGTKLPEYLAYFLTNY